jgi:SAM-dependent methyltransferase
LDPAGGRGEFVNAVPADERWLVDLIDYPERTTDSGVKVVIGDVLDVDLPRSFFDGIFVSNLLEHFADPDTVARFLARMRQVLVPDGVIAVMGPNFRYCAREYFDCADHVLPLTHISVEEHLVAAGFEVTEVLPRFLPYSFRSRLPVSAALARAYLRTPPLWRLRGKQFLALARREDDKTDP